MNLDLVFEIIGWSGSIILVVAYLLMSLGRLRAESAPYGLANLVGSLCLGLNGLYHDALPPATLNAIWVLISLNVIWRYRHGQPTPNAPT
jgi:hypothetical membrane protein